MQEAPYRVLVVDDQPANLLLAQAFLQPLDCVVTTAMDGYACLEAVEQEPPDLILLDVMMPRMDGFEVCQRLKDDSNYRHIPVVLLTALNLPQDRVTGIEAGADDFISKPFNRHELLARVKSLLRVKRLEERERLHMRTTLERYVDTAVAQDLLGRPELASPGGRTTDASVLFADVRNFSGWVERTPAGDVVEVINDFLARAVDVVFEYGGAVDKFTGDGLMALFGAPVSYADHPQRAVAAALDIVRIAADVRHASLKRPLCVGCGVNSGEMIVGNIGCERRLDYTAMGDQVNVAARLCDEAAGGQVWVSEATYLRLDAAEAQDLDLLHVKHRREPVHTYSVLRLG